MKTSVIIPSKNANHLLFTHCLPALYLFGYGDEVIVVDTGADPPIEIAWGAVPGIKRLPKAKSFAAACNAGAKEAKGDVLVFLNDDCRVLPGWLEEIHKAIEPPDVVIAGAKLYGHDGLLQHIGVSFSRHRVPYHPHIGEKDHAKFCGVKQVPAVTGALMAVKRIYFDGLKGFCEEFKDGNYEDVDLCLKAHENNLKTVVALDAKGIHIGGQTAVTEQEKYDDLALRRNWQILHDRWRDKPNKFFSITSKSPTLERERAWGLCG